jgi:hypothetical protein
MQEYISDASSKTGRKCVLHNSCIFISQNVAHTGYPALNGSRINHYIRLSIKRVGKIYTFPNTGSHRAVISQSV